MDSTNYYRQTTGTYYAVKATGSFALSQSITRSLDPYKPHFAAIAYNNGNDIIRTLVGEFPDGTKLTEAGVKTNFPIGWKELPLSKQDFYKTITE